MSEQHLYLDVLDGKPVPRPPVWLMRQAGRILPEYRELRASLSGFKELVETPELAAEATCQPVDHLGVDAAIVFSDILTVPEALGLPYEMVPGFGPRFPKVIASVGDLDDLATAVAAAGDLEYVYAAVEASARRLGGRVPLIGFAGAPWTIFCYMIEGQGSKTFAKARRWLLQEPAASQRLLDLLADVTALYLRRQVERGADAVQLFDSWAGVLSPRLYREFALRASRRVLDQLPDCRTVLFAKGIGAHGLTSLPGVAAYGVDWTTPPELARDTLGSDAALQGNLDPAMLYAPPEAVADEARRMCEAFGARHVANLGHGVYPDTPLAGVRAFVDAVQAYRYVAPVTVPS